ncbi:MAG TPA: hypothetical protein VLG46_00575 [Anaerolineae bacterium]|nr:hypothetical protein [Anaerolineae bacterium]
MNRKQFKQWLKRMYETSENEMNCEQFQASLPGLVDFEIAGGDVRAQFATALAHLRQCPDCAAEYEALREVARLELQGRLPQVEESLQKFETAPEVKEGEPV